MNTAQRLPLATLVGLAVMTGLSAQVAIDSDVPGIMDTGGTAENPAAYLIGQSANYAWFFADTGAAAPRIGNATDYNRLTVQNGASADFDNESLTIGSSSGSDFNQMTVTGSTTAVTNLDSIAVGGNGANNSLTISSGGSLNAVDTFVGASSNSSNNSVTITGSGSTLTNTGDLLVGYSGSNSSLLIADGGSVTADAAALGRSAGGASLTVTGTSSSLALSSYLTAGALNGDNNSISVLAGGSMSATSDINFQTTSNSTLLVDGAGSILSTGGLVLGGASDIGNHLTVSDQGLFLNTLSTFTIATGNTLRLDDGYIGWSGDHQSDFANMISGSIFEVSDGAGGWITATADDLNIQYFAGDHAAAAALTGYSGASTGYYTFVSSNLSAVPEPSSYAAIMGLVAGVLVGRRRRKVA